MALTPEDVVNKRFNPTKFREGYDQDEVDDFLDEVVVELRRLNQENEELRQRLVAGESRLAELQRSAAQQPVAQQPDAQQPVAQQPPAAIPAPEQPAYAPTAFDTNAMDPGNTNNLLQLARRLHEEHVREGMEKRDALIAEGHAAAARVVSDAEQGARNQLDALQQETDSLQQVKSELERQLEELRQFERDYRTKLRSYIEGQLHELETSNALNAAPAQAAVTAGPEQYAPAAPLSYGQPQQSDYAPAYGAAQPAEYPGFGTGN
ncbi:MAG TPA: DivIVA domain-containing protein [Pseudolysinimonas sp.]|nr:DivIVA domain-containing protein [Pseudolysinimonas sp.]